jgi:hypothetical protein
MSHLISGFDIRSVAAAIIIIVTGVALWLLTIRASRGRAPSTRSLPVFDEIPLELGKAAESGASLHIGLGTGSVLGNQTITSVAALQVLEGIADAAYSYGIPPVVTVGDPTLLPLAQDILRRACIRAGVPERYKSTAVRFIAPSSIAYALGASDVVSSEKLNANVLVGWFNEEVILLTHSAEKEGLVQMAAADRARALSALYPADTMLAAGEELYASGAQLMRKPHLVASLPIHDLLRIVIILVILLSVVLRIF